MRRPGRLVALCGALGLASCLLPGAAWARPPEGRRHGPPPFERVLERHADELGLDDAVRAKIREIAEEGRAKTQTHDDALRALHDEMRALLSTDEPDQQAVMRKAEEIGAAETARRKERLRTMLAIRALLTPEQRRALIRIHEERRRERHERRDWRGPDGPE